LTSSAFSTQGTTMKRFSQDEARFMGHRTHLVVVEHTAPQIFFIGSGKVPWLATPV